ncbi:protein FAM221B-like [Coregonus clupeaformis]|uniref:protein FAM221B-like n=1 Tax=Coregonus clupeaformis TaxID=59861 RepID=UPI001BE0A8C9|nr:protein FAM221B-like [Coregonus clupeaformis]XP_041755430.1 protein FAM221B-like [Coregonus clupeaformis]
MEQWQFPSGYAVTQPGQKVKDLFGPEREAALKAIQTGVYVGWRCPDFTWDCFRVGNSSMCFCGHHLYEHGKYTGSSVRVPCLVPSCSCGAFAFMPSHPEEVGEPWVRRRPGFDSQVWRALCRCKHPHQQHSPRAGHSCRVGGCRCVIFHSSFLCASCDQHWEQHETFFDTEQSRRKQGLPFGEAYMPFAEVPTLRNAVLTGRLKDTYALSDSTGRAKEPSAFTVSTRKAV